MKEVQYVVQIKTSVIRQVEFIDMPNLSAAEIEEYAKGLAAMEVGSFDESEILLVETHPTKHAPDVAKATAQKGVLHKNRSGKRAGVA